MGYYPPAARFKRITIKIAVKIQLCMLKKHISSSLVESKRKSFADYSSFLSGNNLHPSYPIEIFLEISNICDLQCAMCHMFSAINKSRQAIVRSQKRGFIDTELLNGSLDSILEHALIVHAFGYGEPTLHPHFPELLDYLGKFGVMVDFFSHGNNLSQELCDLLVDKGVSEITISLSGSNANDYENVYLGGTYKNVLDSLSRLKATKINKKSPFPKVIVNSIGFKHHVLSLPKFMKLMSQVGVSRVDLKPLTLTEAIKELDNHAADPSASEVKFAIRKAKIVGLFSGVRLAAGAFETTPLPTLKVSEFTPITMFPSKAKSAEMRRDMREQSRDVPKLKTIELEDAKYFNISSDATPCFEPFKTLYLAQTGNVYPCCFKSDQMSMGTIKERSLIEIWRESIGVLRAHAIKNEYPEQLCLQCVKNNLYPKSNGARLIAYRYGYWFRKQYGEYFLSWSSILIAMSSRVFTKLMKIDVNSLVAKKYQ